MRIVLTNGYGVAVYPPGATYGPRRLLDYEFVLMIEGEGEYHCGGDVTTIQAGSVLLCKPGSEDYFRWDRNVRTSHAFIHFDVAAIPDGYPAAQDWPLIRTLPDGDIFRPLFRHFMTWLNRRPSSLSESTLSELLNIFVFGHFAISRYDQKTWSKTVEEALVFVNRSVDENPALPVTPTELAAAVCVSPQHLGRLFKSSMGISTAEIIRLARLDYAAGLLARSNFGVGEVSAICGFANPYHFSRLFKAKFHKTPSEVRASGVRPSSDLVRVFR